MTDVVIRNVPDEQPARIDEHAYQAGLSRGDYLRRKIAQDAARGTETVRPEDFRRAAEINRDLLDEGVMSDAWS